ncbi:hypothetical protein X801_00660, partial [Opisthorchis viverrini]
MRKAPQSSHISEPTMLVPTASRPKEPGPRTAYSSLPTPVEEGNIARSPRINGHSTNTCSTMQRAMSMYNLAENGQKASAQFPFQKNSTSISPTAVCGSFFMASQIYYDSRVMDSTASVSATLSRRPKLASRKTDELSGPNDMLPHKPREIQKPYVPKQPDFTMVMRDGPRHFSRLDRPELLTSFVPPGAPCSKRESNWSREFQREGSQTDSGISNSSSVEKTVHLNALRSSPQAKPLNGRSPPVAYEASHDEVIQCLSGAVLDSVCLTIVSPVIQHPSAPKPPPPQPQVSADQTTPAAVMNKSDPISDQSTSASTSSATYYSMPVDDNSKGYQVPGQSAKSGRPVLSTESSELSSARSSDRTNYEGVWSQSTGTSSNNVSARSSLVSRPHTLNISTKSADVPPAVRQYSGSKLDVQINALPQPPKVVGLTRSRTTSGLAEVHSTTTDSTSLAQSLYFARHPRFRRIGSHDSQSSTSSVGVPACPTQTRKIPVRSRSGVHTEPRSLKNMNLPQKLENPCNGSPGGAKITVIKADREASRQRISSAETINSNNIRHYPAIQRRSPPTNEQVNPELVLLPPPAQFR